MSNHRYRWAVAALVLWLPTAPARAEPRSDACFDRGVAIHNMMNWAAVEESNHDRYASPAFVGPNYQTSDALLRNVARAGFDFVRLTLDPGPFLQFTGAERDALDGHLVDVVTRLLAQGLCVIVDFHPTSQVPVYAPQLLVEAIDSPLFRGYVAAVRRTAGLLMKLRTDRVALELMNEPQYGWDAATAARWQRMLELLHGEARAAAPDLRLILTGARGGDAKGLMAVDPEPFRGSRVLYSFHYYEPHVFTHQGVRSDQPSAWPWRFISGLPYPARSRDPAQVWSAIEQNIEADTTLNSAERRLAFPRVREPVSSYLASGFDRARIAADFDAVLNWANEHHIDPRSILLGEFGVTRTYGMYRASDAASQEAWLHDVRIEAERRGFRWALWALSGYGGMALVKTDGSDTLDPVSLRALGLDRGY